jgi:transcriptional regulator with XRE-family HTH domain
MAPETSNFAANLRFACEYYPSISAVCRKLAINRQQFNSYLNGTRSPSRFNLKKICDLFGVDEDEFFLEHQRFVAVISGRRGERALSQAVTDAILKIEGIDQPGGEKLGKYAGFYACYYRSCASPGSIIRAFAYVKQVNDEMVIKTIERLRIGHKEGAAQFAFRRLGRLFQNSSRLFVIDYESNVNFTPSMTILYPAHRNNFRYLNGVRLDLSSAASQRPFAARVVYERLGTAINVRKALRAADMYPETSGEIPDEVLMRIDNQLAEASSVLTAFE